MPSYREGQRITEALYRRARKNVLRMVAEASERIDALHQADADAIKDALRKAFELRGVPHKRVAKAIDEVLSASRPARLQTIEQAIIAAAKEAVGLDEQTFRAVFGNPEAALPFTEKQSDSPPSAKHSLRLVSESEDGSAETD